MCTCQLVMSRADASDSECTENNIICAHTWWSSYTQTVSHSWLISQDGLTAKLQGVDDKSTTALLPVCHPGIPQLTASGTVIPTKSGN